MLFNSVSIVSPGNNIPVSLGLKPTFEKYLTKADQVKETFQDYPLIIHPNHPIWWKGSGRRTVKFPHTEHFPPRRGISLKQGKKHSFMLCFPFPLSMGGFEREIISRIRSNKGQSK